MLIEFIILLGLALFIFYKWSTSTFDFFEKIGIPYDKPFPLFGSQKDIVLRKSSMYDNVNRLYKQFNTSIFGIFDQRNPIYAIRDPELVKRIMVKDFDHFINHREVFNENFGGLFGKSLFFMRNNKWKNMRHTLSPVFTGSKMRQMFILINEVAKESMDFLKEKSENHQEIDFDIKNYFTKFTNDTIASAVFGLKINSFKDECNEFYLMGKRVTTPTILQSIKFYLYLNLKSLSEFLKIQIFSKADTDYFSRLVLDTMKYRENNNISRPDMVHMLMEARGSLVGNGEESKNSVQWTDEEIVAQFFLFLFAGFEITATMMAFAASELMQNPDMQEKLRQEIFEVKRNLNGEPLTYEVLQSMKYMDMVVSETLRRWTPTPITFRHCNKDFTYKDDDVHVTIKAGETIAIPIVGFHQDEQYFPNPEKFDPERFSDENKGNIRPFTYLPFGIGPRSCLGT
ncbi:probable cytochrome P450 9f2 isoform X4 [Eupeodes corollae]|uniref:probable cytochrome P450 9f2 isoform X4 n=1 Tax=Eupeodes corollae TaxID=290404 RepID=UPI0024939DCA|nr:probable cytochrome P450 9f2 isoform X4 [Eupeodes corollae]